MVCDKGDGRDLESYKSLVILFSHERDATRYRFHFSGMSLCPDLWTHVGFKKDDHIWNRLLRWEAKVSNVGGNEVGSTFATYYIRQLPR